MSAATNKSTPARASTSSVNSPLSLVILGKLMRFVWSEYWPVSASLINNKIPSSMVSFNKGPPPPEPVRISSKPSLFRSAKNTSL